MKQIVYGLSAAGIVLLVIVGLFTIEGKRSVEKDLKGAVRESAYEALGEAVTTGTDDRALSILFRTILMKKLSEVNDAGESIDIKIKAADAKDGLLSVNVLRSFTYPNGNRGMAKADCTVILEQEKERKKYRIRYLVPWKKARDLGIAYKYGEDSVFAEYTVEEGRPIPVPGGIGDDGFLLSGSESRISAKKLSNIRAGKDMDIYE